MLRDEKKNKTDFGVYHARKISAQKYRVEINKSGGEFVNVKIITKGPFGCFPFSFFFDTTIQICNDHDHYLYSAKD